MASSDCGGNVDPERGIDDCVRRYMLYVPTIVCLNDDNGRKNTAGSIGGILPIWMAVHCLGCSSSTFFYLTDLAESYRMILVIPEGLQRSFNAENCCGYALEHNVNDVGFLEEIITTLEGQFSRTVHRSVAYGMGWSNGGYMVMKAASLFRAIAPISGYQVGLPYSTSGQQQHHSSPIGLFLHHSEDDNFVRPSGCCRDPTMPKCCCHLSDYLEECVSVDAQVESWARQINHCDTDAKNDKNNKLIALRIEDTYDCWTFASDSCQANTTYCIHQHKGHFNQPSFEASFPMSSEIANFFGRDACSLGGGTWRTQEKTCQCLAEYSVAQSPYCLDASNIPLVKSSIDNDSTVDGTASNKLTQTKNDSWNDGIDGSEPAMYTMALLIAATAVVAFLVTISYWRRRSKLPGIQFQKVPTSSHVLEMRSL